MFVKEDEKTRLGMDSQYSLQKEDVALAAMKSKQLTALLSLLIKNASNEEESDALSLAYELAIDVHLTINNVT